MGRTPGEPASSPSNRTRWRWAAVAVVLVCALGALGVGLAKSRLFPPAILGIQATAATRAATGEIVLRDPTIAPGRVINFGQETVFSVTAAPSGASDELVVLLGNPPQEVAHLNDIGWPPDEQSLDGVWTGSLAWSGCKLTDADLPLRFEYRRSGAVVAALDSGRLTITETLAGIRDFTCVPAGQVTVQDNLLLTADLGIPDLPGTVVAVIGAAQEVALHDDGREPDAQVRDGVYTAQLAVPVSLDYNTPSPTRVEYRSSSGELLASLAGADIVLQPPEIYLTGLSYSPARPLEIGEALTVTALLNRSDKQVRVDVAVTRDGTVLRAYPSSLEGFTYHDGARSFLGQWEGLLTWPHELTEPGDDYYLVATISDRGRVVSRQEAGPLSLLEPRITIIDYRFDPPPPLSFGQSIGVQAHTNKPTNAGALRLVIDGEPCCVLVDDGSNHYEDSVHWWDETKQDGEWVGLLKWYRRQNDTTAGNDLPAQLEYVLGERVLASYELPPLKILAPDIHIESFYREPEGPLPLGSSVRFIVDLSKPVSLGQLKVTLADGTLLASTSKVDGDRVTLEMTWREVKHAGDYGAVFARYYLHPDDIASELSDAPLVVVNPSG